MSLREQQRVQLLDGQDRLLGDVVVREVRDPLVFGQFQEGPDFAAVAPLFAEHREAAGQQLFSRVEELDEAIAGLGLRLNAPDGPSPPAIRDVEIGAGRITFRWATAPDEQARNGAAATSSPTRPLTFGKYQAGRQATLEDFQQAEWHGDKECDERPGP